MLCEWNQLCVIFWGFFPTQHNSIEICPCCCVSQFVPLLLTTVQQWMCHTELRFLCSQFVKFFLSRLLVFGATVTRAFWSPSYKNYHLFYYLWFFLYLHLPSNWNLPLYNTWEMNTSLFFLITTKLPQYHLLINQSFFTFFFKQRIPWKSDEDHAC